jgi:hypothetical protein
MQEVKRELPPNWHLVGPTGHDFSSPDFPPPLADAKMLNFIEQAVGKSGIWA